MKKILMLCFVFISGSALSQKRVYKQLQSTANSIEISTLGLDSIVIENSESTFIEMTLYGENQSSYDITLDDDERRVKMAFLISKIDESKEVFRKFITKRLERSHAVIKIPINKELFITGNNINLVSKNYRGNISCIIDKGTVRLGEIQKETFVQLYGGAIYADVQNVNFDISTNLGNVLWNNKEYTKSITTNDSKKKYSFVVKSIKANIVLSSQKTQ